jgi:hypothetical protein
MRAVRPQRMAVVPAIDADHEREAAPHARLHARDRILDHRPALRRHPEARSSLEQDRRVGLAGQPQLGHVVAVDLGVEPVEHAGVAQDRRRVATGREHRGPDAGALEGVDESERAWKGLDPVLLKPGMEVPVLAVAEPADRLLVGVIVLLSAGQLHAARREELPYPIVTRFSVDILTVVAIGIERPELFAALVGALPQILVEQPLPRRRMRLRRVGHHAVHIEQHGIEVPRREGQRHQILPAFGLPATTAHAVLLRCSASPPDRCSAARTASPHAGVPARVLCRGKRQRR